MMKQWELNAGMFTCDGHLVISNTSAAQLFPDRRAAAEIPVSIIHADLWSKIGYGAHGHAHALNTPVFIKPWGLIVREGHYKKYRWTVKLDVDAVLVVPRLRALLRSKPSDRPVYLLNAPDDQVGNFLHGPVEVLNELAVEAYRKGAARCRDHVDYSREGEDYFLNFCLKYLGVAGVREMRLLQDAYMWGQKHVTCNTGHAVFHPTKSVEEVAACVSRIRSPGVFMMKFGSALRGPLSGEPTGGRWRAAAALAAAGASVLAAALAARRRSASPRGGAPWQP